VIPRRLRVTAAAAAGAGEYHDRGSGRQGAERPAGRTDHPSWSTGQSDQALRQVAIAVIVPGAALLL
jgi:hypothetical protein